MVIVVVPNTLGLWEPLPYMALFWLINGDDPNWAVLSDEQMSNEWQFSLLNDEQTSNKVGVEHQPANYLHPLGAHPPGRLNPFEAMSWIYVAMMVPWNGRFLRWCRLGRGETSFLWKFHVGVLTSPYALYGTGIFPPTISRLQICPRNRISETFRHRWYQAGSKYWFSGPNLQLWIWFKFMTNVGKQISTSPIRPSGSMGVWCFWMVKISECCCWWQKNVDDLEFMLILGYVLVHGWFVVFCSRVVCWISCGNLDASQKKNVQEQKLPSRWMYLLVKIW